MLFLWNQSINSFIPIGRMDLWSPIIKRNEIIMWICVYPNWKMNFNCKNDRKRSFSSESKASILLSQREEWICRAQSLKERRLLCESVFVPTKRQTLIPKMVEREVFLMKHKHQIIYPNKDNEFVGLIIKKNEIILWIRIYPN